MVGRAICKSLVKHGYGNKDFSGEIFAPTREEIDYSNNNHLSNWFAKYKPNIVIVAAAKVGGIYANNKEPTQFLLENLKIQNNLIELSWKFGVKRLLFLGSSCIYPRLANQPIKEESLLTGPLEETNQWYALAKIAGIKLCEALSSQYNFDAICLMPTNLYGPFDNYNLNSSHVLPAFIKRFHEAVSNSSQSVECWGSGTPLREFLHVDDLAEACIFALEYWDISSTNSPLDENGKPLIWLNVGSNSEISIKELANLIAKLVGYKGEILWDSNKPDGTPRKKLDNSRINCLGWESSISLEDGIKNAIYDFRKSKENGTTRI